MKWLKAVREAGGRSNNVSDDTEEVLPLKVIEERCLRKVLARSADDRTTLASKFGISKRTFNCKTKELRIG